MDNIQTFIGRLMIRKRLNVKYDSQFNFYFIRPINEIVQNQTKSTSTIKFKDEAIFSDHNEYLKRMYCFKNSNNRNEINDRIGMLAEFYDTTILVKYEHPMMVVTNTKEIFIKRLKRMKKMVASDCSSQESSSRQNSDSSPVEFESSGFLYTVRTEELSSSSNSMNRQSRSNSKSFESSMYDIFEENVFDFSDTIYQPELRPIKVVFSDEEKEQQTYLSHLISDIDDVDTEKAVKEFKKVKEKENGLAINFQEDFRKKEQNKLKSSKITITPIDNYERPPSSPYSHIRKESNESFCGKNYQKNSKMFRKQFNRVKHCEQRDVYDETIRLHKSKQKMNINLNLNHNLIGENLYENKDMKETQRFRFMSHSPQQQFETRRERRIEEEYLAGEEKSGHNDEYMRKKQKIRERAAALLHKVKSEENLRMSYGPRKHYVQLRQY